MRPHQLTLLAVALVAAVFADADAQLPPLPVEADTGYVATPKAAQPLPSRAATQTTAKTELEWSAELAKQISGKTEFRLSDGSRVDILTETEAIEVEWSDNWAEAIGQSTYYGLATDRQPCVWLLLRGNHDEDYLRCLMVCRRLGITLRTTHAD